MRRAVVKPLSSSRYAFLRKDTTPGIRGTPHELAASFIVRAFSALTHLLSVSVPGTEHHKLHPAKPGRASPFSPSVHGGEPRCIRRGRHTSSSARAARRRNLYQWAEAFTSAPSGMTPSSTNRQSAINSFRGSATIPIRAHPPASLAKAALITLR